MRLRIRGEVGVRPVCPRLHLIKVRDQVAGSGAHIPGPRRPRFPHSLSHTCCDAPMAFLARHAQARGSRLPATLALPDRGQRLTPQFRGGWLWRASRGPSKPTSPTTSRLGLAISPCLSVHGQTLLFPNPNRRWEEQRRDHTRHAESRSDPLPLGVQWRRWR